MIGRVVSLLTVPLTLLGFWGVARQLRKPQRVTGRGLLISVVMATLMLLVNLLFLNRAAPGCFGPIVLLFGAGLGLAAGRATKMEAVGALTVGRRSAVHLVFWALSYAITQVLTTLGSATIAMGGLAAMFFSTGMTYGTQFGLWRGMRRARKMA